MPAFIVSKKPWNNQPIAANWFHKKKKNEINALCDSITVFVKRGGDYASNQLIDPLVGYIFGWHDRFVICPRCVFFIQKTDQSLVGVLSQRVNEWDRQFRK